MNGDGKADVIIFAQSEGKVFVSPALNGAPPLSLAAMIVFDRPRPVVFHHFQQTSHLISTLEAPWSTEEILDFGARIGLRGEWLQHRGHWKEHFDLFDEGILRARDAGAIEVARRRMAEMNERRLQYLREIQGIAA